MIQTSICINVREALHLYTHRAYQPYLLTNFNIYGVLKGWVYAELTTWVKAAGKDQAVAFVVGTYGVSLVLSGLVHGKIFDMFTSKTDKIALFLSPLLLGIIGLVIAFTTRLQMTDANKNNDSNINLFYIASALIGASNGGVESCGYAITSFLYPAKEQTAVAVASKLYVEVAGQVVGFLFPTIFQKDLLAQVVFFIVAFLLNVCLIIRYICQSF